MYDVRVCRRYAYLYCYYYASNYIELVVVVLPNGKHIQVQGMFVDKIGCITQQRHEMTAIPIADRFTRAVTKNGTMRQGGAVQKELAAEKILIA